MFHAVFARPNHRPPGNKAQQVAALRAEDRASDAAAQAALNFSFGEEGRASEVEARDHPFATEHGWEASRYAGCFVYWPTLLARWRWLELVMGHFGTGWRIFAVFLLMAGLDIRSIEQLKHVRAKEAARVLGLAKFGAKTQLWEWFYTVARQGLAKGLLADYCRYQIRAGLVSVWIWFTDGHSRRPRHGPTKTARYGAIADTCACKRRSRARSRSSKRCAKRKAAYPSGWMFRPWRTIARSNKRLVVEVGESPL